MVQISSFNIWKCSICLNFKLLVYQKIKNCCMFKCVNISGEDISALLESHILRLTGYRNVPVPFFCPRFLVRIVLAEDSKLENRGQNGTRVICVYVNMSLPEMTSLQICKLCNCVFCHKSNTSLTHSEHYIKHV